MPTTWPDLIRQANEAVLEQGRREAVAGYFATTCVAHVAGLRMSGHDAVAAVIAALRRAVRDMVVSRFEGGLIAEEWVVTDLAERLLLTRKG